MAPGSSLLSERLMSRAAMIDGAVHLGQPELHTVLLEQWCKLEELVAVERPLVFPNDDRVESPVGVGERG